MIVVLGNFGVGKTQLIRALNNQSFIEEHEPTIGVDFKKIVHDENYLTFWEITGGERFITVITPMYLRKANAVIIMYDVSYAPSFQSIQRWIDLVQEQQGKKIVIIANKIDKERQVETQSGQKLAQDNSATFFQISVR